MSKAQKSSDDRGDAGLAVNPMLDLVGQLAGGLDPSVVPPGPFNEEQKT